MIARGDYANNSDQWAIPTDALALKLGFVLHRNDETPLLAGSFSQIVLELLVEWRWWRCLAHGVSRLAG